MDQVGRDARGCGRDEIGGVGGVDQSPAEGIIGPDVAAVPCRVDQQPFRRRGERCGAEFVLKMLHHQDGGAGHVRRGHRGAVPTVVVAIRPGQGGVELHAVADHVRLDPAVIGGPVAGKAGHRDIRTGVRIDRQVLHGPDDQRVLGGLSLAQRVETRPIVAIATGSRRPAGVGHKVPTRRRETGDAGIAR